MPGSRNGVENKGGSTRQFLSLMEMSCILNVMVLTWLHECIKTHETIRQKEYILLFSRVLKSSFSSTFLRKSSQVTFAVNIPQSLSSKALLYWKHPEGDLCCSLRVCYRAIITGWKHTQFIWTIRCHIFKTHIPNNLAALILINCTLSVWTDLNRKSN